MPGDGFGVIAVPIHAHGQRLDAPSGQICVEHRGDRTGPALEKRQLLIKLCGIRDHYATDHVGMPTQIFRGGVQHVVGPQRQRVLQIRRRKCIVHNQLGAVEQFGDRRDVGDRQRRIGRGLQPHEFRIRRDSGGNGVGRSGVDNSISNAPLRKHRINKPKGTAISIVTENQMVTRAQQRAQQHVGGGHAGGKRPTISGTLQRGNGFLQGGNGGVATAGVFVAAPKLVQTVLGKRGGGVDGGINSPIEGIRVITRVDAGSGKPLGLRCTHRRRSLNNVVYGKVHDW